MHALILAGGKGTRLRPLTVYTPKPIVPIANRPLLLYQIEILRSAGIQDITLSLSYQPDKIEHLLGDGSEHGVRLRYITEPSPMGTGGAYKFAADEITETTVVLNGDILTDTHIGKMIEIHTAKGAAATLALAPVDDPARYGLVLTDEEGRILNFIEKPKADTLTQQTTNTINAGIYILEPSILNLLPKGENCSFEYDIFPKILEQNLPFFGYILKDEYWRDIGTPESYLEAHEDILSGRISAHAHNVRDNSDIATAAMIDKTSIIGEGCVIKPGAHIMRSVLGQGVHVEEKAVVENSVIWSHTRVANAAVIKDAIIGRSCHVGRNATVGRGTVLGDKTTLTDYTRV